MGGKASILLVLAFSTIFLVIGLNISSSSINSTKNVVDSYRQSDINRHAKALADLAMREVTTALSTNNFNPGTENIQYGEYNASITTSLLTTPNFSDVYRITTEINYAENENDYKKTFNYYIYRPSMQQYAYFSNIEPSNIIWTTGSKITGAFYVNSNLNIAGSPEFLGKVEYNGKIVRYQENIYGYNPKFHGGHGFNQIPMPVAQNMTEFANLAGKDGKLFNNVDKVYLKFEGDNIRFKYAENDAWSAPQLGKTFAPNGCIVVNNGALYVEGTVKGQYSIGALGTSQFDSTDNKFNAGVVPRGNVFINGSIKYGDQPDFNNAYSPEKHGLGIISQNNVLIKNVAANHGKDVDIQGMIYCQKGGFGVENYKSFPVSGKIKLRGGITQNVRRAVGTFSNNNDGSIKQVSGFDKDYLYDQRMANNLQLPFFPLSQRMQLLTRNSGMLKTSY